jgi:hypothetical protein
VISPYLEIEDISFLIDYRPRVLHLIAKEFSEKPFRRGRSLSKQMGDVLLDPCEPCLLIGHETFWQIWRGALCLIGWNNF